jgi:Ca2+-binding EF-hand superfamily protein
MAASEPGATVTISLRLGTVSKRVVVYPGLPTDELRRSIEATFGQARDTVTAVRDVRLNKTYALADLTSSPTFFSRTRFDLVIGGAIPIPQHAKANATSIPPEVPASRNAIPSAETSENGEGGERLSQIFSLTNVDVKRIMVFFKQSAPDGVLDRPTFKTCFHQFFATNGSFRGKSSDADQRRMEAVLNRLFDIFDRDGDGLVDSQEFLSGLSVLCHGERDEKIRAAFELYDYDGDNFITQDEMRKYLSSVFAVINETSPQVFQQYG